MKNSEIYKSVMDKFPDAELIDVNSNKDGVQSSTYEEKFIKAIAIHVPEI